VVVVDVVEVVVVVGGGGGGGTELYPGKSIGRITVNPFALRYAMSALNCERVME